MATPTMNPAGWYTDPTGRHDARFWDSAHWTSQVVDHGMTTVEAPAGPYSAPLPTAPPYAAGPPPYAGGPPPPPYLAPPPVVGYRAVAVAPWRIAMVRVGMLAMSIAFFYEVIASVGLNFLVSSARSSYSPPSEGSFVWCAWLFHYTSTHITYTYPPLLIWIALAAAYFLSVSLVVSKTAALAKVTNARFLLGARDKRQRLGSVLRQAGFGQGFLRPRGRLVMVIFAELGALTTAALSAYAVITKHGIAQNGGSLTYEGDLTLGWGPMICLIASLIAIVCLLMAVPMRGDRAVRVFADGSLAPDNTGPPR